MKAGLPLVLALMACGDSEGVDALDRRLSDLEAAQAEVVALREELAQLRAHERVLAEEVVGAAVLDDQGGFEGQLAASRVDELAALTGRVGATEEAVVSITSTVTAQGEAVVSLTSTVTAQGQAVGDLQTGLAALDTQVDELEAHERALAAEVVSELPVERVVADFEGQLSDSRLDRIVTDPGLPDLSAYALISYVDERDAAVRTWVDEQGFATTTQVSAGDAAERIWVNEQGYATTMQVSAGDAAERTWVVGQGYLTDAALGPYALTSYVDSEVSAGDAAERAWVVSQGYLTDAALTPYAMDADVLLLTSRVGEIEADYLQSFDLEGLATEDWVTAGFPEQAEFETVIADHASRVEALEDGAEALNAVLPVGGEPLLGRIVGDRTFTVHGPGSDFEDLNQALASLAGLRIDPGAVVTLAIQDGTWTYPDRVLVDHPDGERIHIVGMPSVVGTSPVGEPPGVMGSVVLSFFDSDGIVVERGERLGMLDQVVLDGGRDRGATAGTGLSVRDGGFVGLGGKVSATNWPAVGLRAERNGVMVVAACDVILAEGNGDSGVLAELGGVILITSANFDLHRCQILRNHNGVVALDGGVVRASETTSSENTSAGYLALFGGVADVPLSRSDLQTYGFEAQYGGVVDANDSYSGDSHTGVSSRMGGVVHADGLQVFSSTVGMHASRGGLIAAMNSRIWHASFSGFEADLLSIIEGTGANVEDTSRAENHEASDAARASDAGVIVVEGWTARNNPGGDTVDEVLGTWNSLLGLVVP